MSKILTIPTIAFLQLRWHLRNCVEFFHILIGNKFFTLLVFVFWQGFTWIQLLILIWNLKCILFVGVEWLRLFNLTSFSSGVAKWCHNKFNRKYTCGRQSSHRSVNYSFLHRNNFPFSNFLLIKLNSKEIKNSFTT